MRIHVKQEHINCGTKESKSRCPIALALSKQLSEDWVYVYRYTVDIGFMKETLNLPQSAQKFIGRFDKGKIVKPFNFNLKYNKEIVNRNEK